MHMMEIFDIYGKGKSQPSKIPNKLTPVPSGELTIPDDVALPPITSSQDLNEPEVDNEPDEWDPENLTIEDHLRSMGMIETLWTIHSDGTVDYRGNINIVRKFDDLTQLPIKFGRVDGDFEAAENGFTSLINFPEIVTGGVDISECPLENLNGLPKYIGQKLIAFDLKKPGMWYRKTFLSCIMHGVYLEFEGRAGEDHDPDDTHYPAAQERENFDLQVERILNEGRDHGTMPSVLIPKRIQELKSLDLDLTTTTHQ